MNTVFLDTGYVLALELANDQNHRAAIQHWQSIRTAIPPLVTTSYVFDRGNFFAVRRGVAWVSGADDVLNTMLAPHRVHPVV
jgi:predicted nucleic acid-binding protein